jgi:hypothetical protein
VAALAVTTAAAVAQTRPTSEALAARRLAEATNPAAHQVCQRRGPAVYCVYPGFEPQIALWEPTVQAVLAGVPPAVAARAVPVTVAQRVGWPRLLEEEEGGEGEEASVAGDQGRAGDRPVAPIGTVWGLDGPALATSRARLASNVAALVTRQPDHVPPPGGEPPTPGSGPAVELPPPNLGCNARAVVALWLAARASPHAAAGLRQQVTNADARFPFVVFTNDVSADEPIWGLREAEFALALLDRPGDQVTQTLWSNWDLLMDPATTLERLGELVGTQPPPQRASAPEFGGQPC